MAPDFMFLNRFFHLFMRSAPAFYLEAAVKRMIIIDFKQTHLMIVIMITTSFF